MLSFKKDKYGDYEIHDTDENFLGTLIYYEFTGEWLYKSPHKCVVMSIEEVKEIVTKTQTLG